MDNETREKKRQNPREKAGYISSLLLLYMIPVFWSSCKKTFTEDDLYEPLEEHKSCLLGEKLEQIWIEEQIKNKKWALHKALLRMFGLELLGIGLLTLINEIMMIALAPTIIRNLVNCFSSDLDRNANGAFMYGVLLILLITTERMISHPNIMWLTHLKMKMRVACSSLMYRKSLRLSQSALAQTTIGQMVNLLSNDVGKFDQCLLFVHFFWIAPIITAIGTYMLYINIGVVAFIGIGFIVLFLPLHIWIGKRTSVLRFQTALKTDERVRTMHEIISGIQVIKMYTWEEPFSKLISLIRKKEVKTIRANKYLRGIISSFEVFVTRAAIFISLISYVFLGNKIDAGIVFAITSIYNALKNIVAYLFSMSISSIAEINVSINRLQTFMSYDEVNEIFPEINYFSNSDELELHGKQTESFNSIKECKQPRVIFTNIFAKWQDEITLNNVSFEIKNPLIFAIIGPVGSGKSSILSVILRELPVLGGDFCIDGKISYCSQEPWIFSGSARQNILFGSSYNDKRYQQVCKVCALESDFDLFPYGDGTLVGEQGKALSGGQKARINLARCIYRQADIYLLDDPLSAVDANVGKQLYDECIQHFLRDKICILITHQLQYLNNVDNILILKDGYVNGQGTFKKLQSSGLNFANLLKDCEAQRRNVEEIEKNSSMKKSATDDAQSKPVKTEGPILDKELMNTGKVKLSTYTLYFKAGGSWFVILLLLACFIASQAASSGSDYYVTYWVNIEQDITDNKINSTEDYYSQLRYSVIYEYTVIIIVVIIMSIIHSIFFYVFLMKASVKLHDIIFFKLIKTTMTFFNTNLTGRILNRFSKDLGVIDEYISDVMIYSVEFLLYLLGAIILTTIVYTSLIFPSALLILIVYLMRIVFLKVNRNVKRIEGIRRSPIYGQMATSIQGLSTIRAFSAENVIIKEFDNYQDLLSSANFINIASSRAYGCWADLVCVIFISICILSVTALSQDLYSGNMGLLVTQYMGFTGVVQYGMRQWSELETQMTSVERILEYTKLENEPRRNQNILKTLPINWPSKGKLEFKNLSLKYDISEPFILKNLNFEVKASEKVGIVGRTGAGKSSIIVALFQLYKIDGLIIIDDVDTTKLPLDIIRSKIAIIPQEPVLFAGTMRKNLDPFNEFSDDILWNALEQVELKKVIADLDLGLSANISEGGSNFSVGQKQLICLARAIIRSNRILVLDEATANVDPHTDALIQKTIRKQFVDCTVLTIAHRLNTVMDSDKILVMDAGNIIEFDHPYLLLKKDSGIFKSMVETTGIFKALSNIAEQSYKKYL